MTVQLVREVMTTPPVTVSGETRVSEAAGLMREHDIGDVLVVDEEGNVEGILTDRDVAVRVVAVGRNPEETPVREVYSSGITRLDEEETIEHAFELMRRKAIRRLPVVQKDHHRLVGVLSLGDLMVHRYPGSTLARISAAPPNK